MFISYDSDEIRNCCLLLGSSSLNSNFSTEEIKDIRAVIADLKASPNLSDSPLEYIYNKIEETLTIEYGSIKMLAETISKNNKSADIKIDRIKIINIFNVNIQSDLINKTKQK